MKKDSVMKRIAPGLVLLFMGPLLGELVSGHQSPLQFTDPFNFLITALPYRAGRADLQGAYRDMGEREKQASY